MAEWRCHDTGPAAWTDEAEIAVCDGDLLVEMDDGCDRIRDSIPLDVLVEVLRRAGYEITKRAGGG